MTNVQQPARIPQQGVDPAGVDILVPTVEILEQLNILPNPTELGKADGFGSAFKGAPASVALIEAGGTAMAKWWSAGLSGVVLAVWGSIKVFWTGIPDSLREVLLWGASIATAAVVLAVGYLLAADLAGRSRAMVATLNARCRVAEAMVAAAQHAYTPPAASAPTPQIAALPVARAAILLRGKDSNGWTALALRVSGADTDFLLNKDADHQWIPSADVQLC